MGRKKRHVEQSRKWLDLDFLYGYVARMCGRSKLFLSCTDWGGANDNAGVRRQWGERNATWSKVANGSIWIFCTDTLHECAADRNFF
jgi:hypothetical protein